MGGKRNSGAAAVETAVQIRWGDMDALGHVNNATYLAYLETAREPYEGIPRRRAPASRGRPRRR